MLINYFSHGRNFLSLFSILLLAVSCQKEAQAPVDCPQTVAAIAGTYKLTALKYKASASSAEQDYLLLKEPCELDDIISLNANGTYNYQDAGISCSPDGTDSGTWSISGNTIISDGIVSGTIQSFDCRNLIAYSNDVIIPGDRITLTIEKQ